MSNNNQPQIEDSLKKRYLIKLFANLIAGMVNIAIMAIVPKALGPIVFGQFVYLQNFFMQFLAVLDASTSTAFFTKLSADNSRKTLISFYGLISILLFFLVFSIIFIIDYLGYSGVVFPDVNPNYIFLGLSFGFLAWFSNTFTKISDAYALTVSIELVRSVHKVVLFLLLLGLVSLFGLTLESYFYLQYFSQISLIFLTSIIFFYKSVFTRSLITLNYPIKKLTKEFYQFCSPLFFYGLLAVGAGIFDIWLLQSTSGSQQTGFYGLAYGIASIGFLFAGALTPVISREFAKHYANNELDAIANLLKQYAPMIYSVVAYFSAFIVIKSEVIVLLFAGNEFLGATLAVAFMSFYPLQQIYGQLGGSILYATQNTKRIRNIGYFSISIGVAVSLILIYWLELQALGLVLKMLLTQAISVGIYIYYVSKLLNIPLSFFVKNQLFVIALFLGIAYLTSLLNYHASVVVDFLLNGILYSFIVVAIILIKPSIIGVKPEKLKSLFSELLSKMKNEKL